MSRSQGAKSKVPKVLSGDSKAGGSTNVMKPRHSSSSSRASSDNIDDRAAMLAALEARGRAMFGINGPDDAESSYQGGRRCASSGEPSADEEDDESEADEDEDEGEGEDFVSDDGWGEGDEMVSDSEDEILAADLPSRSVPEVVFAPTAAAPQLLSKAERKAFMHGSSAKIMGIKPEQDHGPKGKKRARDDDDEDVEDRSNLKLDKTLHDMLLTTLLPSAKADSAQRPVDKRKAVSGRLLELAQYQLPGEGSKILSSSHLSSHPAKIRAGMIHAQERRDAKARSDAEAAGSFVRGLGGLGGEGRGKIGRRGRGTRAGVGEDVGKKKGMEGRRDNDKRDRGLGMGVGRFQRGMLKLSESDIARGSQEGPRRGRGGSKRGGKKKGRL